VLLRQRSTALLRNRVCALSDINVRAGQLLSVTCTAGGYFTRDIRKLGRTAMKTIWTTMSLLLAATAITAIPVAGHAAFWC
jgi:hypothetical protein